MNHRDDIKVSDELEIVSRVTPCEFEVYKDGKNLGTLSVRSKFDLMQRISSNKHCKVFAIFKNHLLIDIR
jgi:hypothetical protein